MEQILENHEIGNLGSQIYFVWVATNTIPQLAKEYSLMHDIFGMKFKCLIFC